MRKEQLLKRLNDYKHLSSLTWNEAISDRAILYKLQRAYDLLVGRNNMKGYVCRPNCKEALEVIKELSGKQTTLWV